MSVIVAKNSDAGKIAVEIHVDNKFDRLTTDLAVFDIPLTSRRIIDKREEGFSAVGTINAGFGDHVRNLHPWRMIAWCRQAQMPSY